ncbi:MAG: hypothetical protein GYB31_00475 [Bacteroidetes bacterium]|nr:hypothetical protein [Bacteroidota bacterium]
MEEDGKKGLVAAPKDQGYADSWDNAKTKSEKLVINGYNDWFLPSKDQLNLMFNNLHNNSLGKLGNFEGGWYWADDFFLTAESQKMCAKQFFDVPNTNPTANNGAQSYSYIELAYYSWRAARKF